MTNRFDAYPNSTPAALAQPSAYSVDSHQSKDSFRADIVERLRARAAASPDRKRLLEAAAALCDHARILPDGTCRYCETVPPDGQEP